MIGSTYDADGRPEKNKVDASSKPVESITGSVGGYYTYPTTYPVEPALEITQTFDGGRDIAKRQEISRKDEPQGEDLIVVEETTLTYYLRSEVLGGKTIAEVKPDATKRQGNVYANGALLAEWNNGASMVIEMNPLTGCFYKVDSSGNAYRHERDPTGAVMGIEDPWLSILNPVFKDMMPNEQPFIEGGDPFNPNGGCELDGMPTSCSFVQRGIDNGSVEGGGIFRDRNNNLYYKTFSLQNNVFWGSNSYSILIPGNNDAPTPPGGKPSITYGTQDTWETFYFGGFGDSRPPRGPHPPSGPPPPSGPSQDCLNALAAIKKDVTGYNNAMNLLSIFQAVNPSPAVQAVLMAMAIRESNADPNAVESGGGGRGLMQVDITMTPGKAYANDPNLMTANGSLNITLEIMENDAKNFTPYGFKDDVSRFLMMLRSHNGGWFKQKNGKVDQKKMRQMATNTNESDFDVGTTNGNYVTSVLKVARTCFAPVVGW